MANFTDYHKYVSNKRTYHKICQISNLNRPGFLWSITISTPPFYKKIIEFLL